MRILKFLAIYFAIGLATNAAPLVNGDFTQPVGNPGWRFVTASNSTTGGSINTGAGNAVLNAPSPFSGFLGTGSIFGARMQTQVNAAINAVQPGAATLLNANDLVGLLALGRGSMIYQTFDTLSGNAGNVIEFAYSLSLNGTARAFAYFFGIDTGEETLVDLTAGVNQTGNFAFSNNTRMLVGFGVLGTGGTSTASLTMDQVSQVPEIDAGSASLPLAICLIVGFLLVDRRRVAQAAQAVS